MICCISIFICFKVFLDFPLDIFNPLTKCCWISTYLWIFRLLFCNWFLVSDHCYWKKIPGMISIFLNLLRLVLWLTIWSMLENVLCTLEMDRYSAPSSLSSFVTPIICKLVLLIVSQRLDRFTSLSHLSFYSVSPV